MGWMAGKGQGGHFSLSGLKFISSPGTDGQTDFVDQLSISWAWLLEVGIQSTHTMGKIYFLDITYFLFLLVKILANEHMKHCRRRYIRTFPHFSLNHNSWFLNSTCAKRAICKVVVNTGETDDWWVKCGDTWQTRRLRRDARQTVRRRCVRAKGESRERCLWNCSFQLKKEFMVNKWRCAISMCLPSHRLPE